MKRRRTLNVGALTFSAIVVAAAALAACGGTGGAAGNALPGAPTMSSGHTLVKVTLAIPKPILQVHRRSPKYFAPTTEGFGFNFTTSPASPNPAAPTVAVNLSNLAAPTIAVDTYGGSTVTCSANPDGSYNCFFVLSVPASTTPYELLVSTYDTPPSTTGTTFNPADLLSQQMIPSVPVTPGSATTSIGLSLDGIPVNAEMVPLPNQDAHLHPNGAGLTLVGTTPVQAYMYGLDRDGNIIVGDGAPQVCVSYGTFIGASPPPTLPIAISVPSPGPSNPGTTCDNSPLIAQPWTLQTQSWSATPVPFQLYALAQMTPIGPPTSFTPQALNITEEQELWVNASTLSSGQVIQGYAFTTGQPPQRIGTDSAAIPTADSTGAGNGGLTIDSARNLWFTTWPSTDFLCAAAPTVAMLQIGFANCVPETYPATGSRGIAIGAGSVGGTEYIFVLDSSAQEVIGYPATLPTLPTTNAAAETFLPGLPGNSQSLAVAPANLPAPLGGSVWLYGIGTASPPPGYLLGYTLSGSSPPSSPASSIVTFNTTNAGESFLGGTESMSFDQNGNLYLSETESNAPTYSIGQEDIFEFSTSGSGSSLAATALGFGFIPASYPTTGTQHSLVATLQGTILDSFQIGTSRDFFELPGAISGNNVTLTPIQTIINDPYLGSAVGLAVAP